MRVQLFVGERHMGTIRFDWHVPESWTVDVDSIEWDVQDTHLESVLRETFENNSYNAITIGGLSPEDIRPYYEVWEQTIQALSKDRRLGLRAVMPSNLPKLQLGEEQY